MKTTDKQNFKENQSIDAKNIKKNQRTETQSVKETRSIGAQGVKEAQSKEAQSRDARNIKETQKTQNKMSADFNLYRQDFPLLQETNRGKPIIYLDSAASAQKPQQVVQAMSHFYLRDYANIHRGIYELSERATQQLLAVLRRAVVSFCFEYFSLKIFSFISSIYIYINRIFVYNRFLPTG